MKDRNALYDIVRGIGIILVVWAHACLPGGVIICYFHMPLFFFIAGYFTKTKDSWTKIINRCIHRFWGPFVLMQVSFLCFHNLLTALKWNDNLYTVETGIKNFFKILFFGLTEANLSQMWFLMIMCTTTILFKFISCMIQNIKNSRIWGLKEEVALIPVAVFLYVIGINLPFEFYWGNTYVINVTLICEVFLIAGWIWRYVNIRKIPFMIKFFVWMFCAVLLVYLYIVGYRIDFRSGECTNWMLCIPVSFAGIYVVFGIGWLVERISIFKKCLVYLGKNTMSVYLWHPIIFNVIGTMLILFNITDETYYANNWVLLYREGFWPILFAVLGLGVPILGGLVLDMIKKIIKDSEQRCSVK